MTFAQPFSGYEILARVGAGAMGTVFKARQKHMNRVVAIKVLKPSLARNEKYVERLRREARIVGALNHPNIVTGYDLGEEGGYHFFVMEFVEGKSLRALLHEWGFFPEAKVLDVGIQVSEALDHAFRQGVIHRDVKPGNILIDEAGHVKLTDMGLAKGPSDLTLTRDGATVGTPHFISPEQARDPQSVDVRSDLYSLGVTLFQMATGTAPFAGDTIGALIHQVLHEPAPLANTLNPALSDGLTAVIAKLLAKDPKLRYQTPAELLSDLRRVQRDEQPGIDLRRLARADRHGGVGRLVPRRWVLVGSIGLSLAAAVVAGSVWFEGRVTSDAATRGARGQALLDELDMSLREADDLRGKFEVVHRFEQRAPDASIAGDVAIRASEITGMLLDAIDRLAESAARDASIDPWINDPSRWGDPDGYLRDVLGTGLGAATGFRATALPEIAQAAWRGATRRVRDAVELRMEERDRQYLQAYERELGERIERVVADALAQDDFVRVRRALEADVRQFHGTDGRPELLQVGDALRTRLQQAERSFTARWRRLLEQRQRQVASELLDEVARETAAVRRSLDAVESPSALHGRLDRFRDQRLKGHYPGPEHFALTDNPWPTVEAELSRLARDLDSREQQRVASELSYSLDFAYNLFANVGAEEAVGYLRDVSLRLHDDRAKEHLELLEAAIAVRDMVLHRLVGDAQDRVEPLSQRHVPVRNGKVSVLRRDDSTLDLVDAKDGASMPFAMVADALLETVSRDAIERDVGDDRRLRAGLALWRLIAGRDGDWVRLVHSDLASREFFAREVVPIVQRVSIRRFGTPIEEGARVMNELVQARDLGNVGSARYWLERARGLGQPNGLDARLVGSVQRWVDAEERRSTRERELRGSAPTGVVVSVPEEGDERIEYGPLALASLDLHAAWNVAADGAAVGPEQVSLATAWQRRLELGTHVDGARGLSAEVEFSIPIAGRSIPFVYLCEIRGVVVALVILPNGMVRAVIVDAGVARDADALRRQLGSVLAKGLESAGPWAVDGARHRLELRLAGDGRTRLVVAFDGVALARQLVALGADPTETVAFVPLAPVTVGAVRITSRG